MLTLLTTLAVVALANYSTLRVTLCGTIVWPWKILPPRQRFVSDLVANFARNFKLRRRSSLSQYSRGFLKINVLSAWLHWGYTRDRTRALWDERHIVLSWHRGCFTHGSMWAWSCSCGGLLARTRANCIVGMMVIVGGDPVMEQWRYSAIFS